MPKSISTKKRWEIIFLHLKQEGPKLPISKVAKRMKTSRWTVSHWVNVFNTTGDVQDKKSTGRPRKTSHKQDKEIEKMVLNYKEANTQNIARELTSLGLNISSRTVHRRLTERGFRYSYPTQKPALTKKQKSSRLSFAKQNGSRNWNNVIYTDETSVSLGPRTKKIWKRRGEKVYTRRKSHYEKVHVWGSFSRKGFGKIVLFTENLTGKKMIEIYKSGLLPIYPDIGRGNWVLLEDNDPKHKAKIVQQYREEKNIERITWPSNSPDLNPIENVWNVMKNQVAELQPSNLTQLQSLIKKVWNNFPQKMAQNLINSMPSRLNQVILRHGDSIDY